MTSAQLLRITCGLGCDDDLDRDTEDLVLGYVSLFDGPDADPPPPLGSEWRMDSVLDQACLAMSVQVSLFRLQLTRPNLEPVDAVLKIDHSGQRLEELRHEARIYSDLLSRYQDHLIPNYYGYFQTKIGQKTVACIITEYCGEPITTSLDKADPAFLTRLIQEVDALHRAGVSHGDLYEGNILVKPNGDPVLVDLEAADSHACERRLSFKQGMIQPKEDEFGCHELYRLCTDAGLWESRYCRFQGCYVDKLLITSLDYLEDTFISAKIFDKNPRRKQQLLGEAKELFATISAEKMKTWGTCEVTKSTKRLDDPSR
ncbi:hypothetical protein C8R47DRAFT_1321040 [Mycena vitilis]|nr:hypothetical protein C8R47DRAFT_1321040 [Mycena vitilis]